MKKDFILMLALLSIVIANASFAELKNGDGLQILYYRVWAYTSPNDVTTHVGPYSYYDKAKFIEVSTEYPGYYKIVTPDEKEAFIKMNLVTDDLSLTTEKIVEEIKAGKRLKSQYAGIKIDFMKNLETWQILVGALLILVGLYFYWKKFYRIDSLFLRYSIKPSNRIQNPWFIKYPAIIGGIIGACLTLFKPAETEWFLNEGMRLWANYNSFWHWLLWGSVFLFLIILCASIIHPFLRLKPNGAVIYSIISFLSVVIYFFAGLLTGGIIAVIIILVLWSKAAGSSKSSSTPTQDDGRYNAAYSQRWNALEKKWEKIT